GGALVVVVVDFDLRGAELVAGVTGTVVVVLGSAVVGGAVVVVAEGTVAGVGAGSPVPGGPWANAADVGVRATKAANTARLPHRTGGTVGVSRCSLRVQRRSWDRRQSRPRRCRRCRRHRAGRPHRGAPRQ